VAIEVKTEGRTRYMRAGVRLNFRVPVRLEWQEAGEDRRVEGQTVDVSPKGCLAIAPAAVPVGQRLRVKNTANEREVEGVLIWRGHEGQKGWELGIELFNAPADFWEVEF
jgi:hypothetical protein